MFYDYFGGGFALFELMFFVIFSIVVIGIIVSAVKGFSEYSSNNNQPVLDVDCKVVSKRTNVTKHAGHNNAEGHFVGGGSSTTYYITFEFESKDRMEFKVNGKEYGMIIENDYGKLKFQGTRYLGFNRI